MLQASIAACHARAYRAEQTDWAQITELYGVLAEVMPSPIVELNRAVAVGMAFGPEAGLALVDQLAAEPSLRGYHLLPSVRGDLLMKLGRAAEAEAEFRRASDLTSNARERELTERRAAGGGRLGRILTVGLQVSGLIDSKMCSTELMSEVTRPDWWSFPLQCPAGHQWGPGRVIVSWSPCDCPGALSHPGKGHQCVRCGTRGCTAAWYTPKHGWPPGRGAG